MLARRTFERPERKGKWLICPTEEPVLLLHFGMTGDLLWWGDGREDHPHDRMQISFEDGTLVYRDMRKLGGVWIEADRAGANETLGNVGPDALDAPRTEFLDRLRSRRGSVKSALMNQKVVSGLGNLTVDESLWRARIAPRRAVPALTDDDLAALYRSVKTVLRSSTKVGRVPDRRGWLTGSRTRDAPCPRCRRRLLRATVAGRTTYWCPACQS